MSNAAALVVGVDKYDDPGIPPLLGNYPSAKRAVEWLTKNGVPGERVFLHVSPTGTEADFPGVKLRPARLDDILSSMTALSRQSGDQLFIFLCGHGLSVQGEKGPIFLAQDYGANPPYSAKNMRLYGAIYWALRWNFADQFLFYDACQNPSSSVGQISLVDAIDPTKLDALPAAPVGGMLACLSAALGQTAWAGNGDGVLVPRVLDALDADALANLPAWAQEQDAVLYDWTSGTRRVDLRNLFLNNVAPLITNVAKNAGNIQTPRMLTEGLAESLKVSPVLDLPPEPSTEFTIKIEPPTAVLAIRQISFRAAASTRKLNLPLENAAIAPTSLWRGPCPNDFIANCGVVSGMGWSTTVPEQKIALDTTPVTVTFEIAMAPPAMPPGPPDIINVRLNGPDGSPSASLGGEYVQIAADNNLSDQVPGVTFQHNEIGPDIGFDAAVGGYPELARSVANDWLIAIRRHVARWGETASLYPAGVDPAGKKPNLRLKLPEGATSLAGFLAETAVLTVTAAGDAEPSIVRSLAEVERHELEWTEPGANRVTLDLPWGRWSQLVAVENGKEQICALPTSIGTPPLRHYWARADIADSPEPLADPVLHRIDPLIADELVLLLDESGADDRVEPFSRTSLPEWDMLFSAGRTDLVEPGRIIAIAEAITSARTPPPVNGDRSDPINSHDGQGVDVSDLSVGERDLLLLGLAHAACAQGQSDALAAALRGVRGPLLASLDYLLLDHQSRKDSGDEDEEVLLTDAADGDSRIAPVVLLRASAELLAERFRETVYETPEWISRLSTSSAIAVRTRADAALAVAEEREQRLGQEDEDEEEGVWTEDDAVAPGTKRSFDSFADQYGAFIPTASRGEEEASEG